MVNLDQPQNFGDFDKNNMIGHIQDLPDQIEQAWEDMQRFTVPTPYIQVKNVVILGMGGSGMGGSIARTLGLKVSKVPIEVVNDYHLPAYIGSDSLVIGISYSGQTEETLMAFQEAGKKKAKLIAITTGAGIAAMASRFKAPTYIINYGSEPRAALGFTFTAVLAVLKKLGFIELGKDDVKESVVLMRGLQTKLNPDIPIYKNEAKKFAIRMENAIVYITGAETMWPIAYRWSSMLNENAKHLATALSIPELCHNWLTGLDNPVELRKSIIVVILQSKFDFSRNRLRQQIVGQLLNKKGIRHEFVQVAPSGSLLSEQLVTIYLGDYISYYLAMLHQVNPTTTEEIIYLKKQLSRKPFE